MMIEKMNLDAPCFCGSHKRYEDCCKGMIEAGLKGDGNDAAPPQEMDKKAFDEFLDKCDQLLDEQKGADAMKLIMEKQAVFGKNVALATAALARVWKKYGMYEAAERFLQNLLSKCKVADASSLALLAQLQYRMGHTMQALNALYAAASFENQNNLSVITCIELFAMEGKHQEIIELGLPHSGDKTYASGDLISHYVGIAYANLGNVPEAIEYLSRVKTSQFVSLARHCLKRLEHHEEPDGLMGAWPYPPMISVMEDLGGILAHPDMTNTHWYAEFLGQCLEWKQESSAIQHLGKMTHPHAREILERVLEWPGATKANLKDARRALGLSDDGTSIKDVKVNILGANLPEGKCPRVMRTAHVFQSFLPDQEAEEKLMQVHQDMMLFPERMPEYLNWLQEMYQKYPDVEMIGSTLSFALHRVGCLEETEGLLKELVRRKPEYSMFFYHLMNLYLTNDQLEKAAELARDARIPETVHPMQANIFWCAMAKFHARLGEYEKSQIYLSHCEKAMGADDSLLDDAREYLEHQKTIERKMKKAMKIMKKKIKNFMKSKDMQFRMEGVNPDETSDQDGETSQVPFVKIKVTEEDLDRIIGENSKPASDDVDFFLEKFEVPMAQLTVSKEAIMNS